MQKRKNALRYLLHLNDRPAQSQNRKSSKTEISIKNSLISNKASFILTKYSRFSELLSN